MVDGTLLGSLDGMLLGVTGASDIGLEAGGAVLGRLVGDREGLTVGFIVVGLKDGRNVGFLVGTAAYVLQRKIPTIFELDRHCQAMVSIKRVRFYMVHTN